MLNLFALTSNPAKRIVRFNLSSQVQSDLTAYMKAQERAFDEADQEVDFDGKYKPDPGEVLCISNYDDIDDLASAINNPLALDEVEPSEEFFGQIKALFTGYNYQGNLKILLQSFDRRKIISTNGLSIFHSANTYKKIEGIGLTVDHKLTAILEEGRLRFFSFHSARQIFDLSEYYKEATDDDVKEFIAADMIFSANPAGILEVSDSWVRRKILLIQQSGILQSIPINEMKAIALDFNIPFETMANEDGEKLLLPEAKSDLKKLLRFLDEDYYKSPLSKTNFLSNSKRIVAHIT